MTNLTSTNVNTAVKSDSACSNYCDTTWYPLDTSSLVSNTVVSNIAVGSTNWNKCDKCICYRKDQFGKFKLPGSFVYMTEDKKLKEVYIKEVMYNNPATIVFWSDDTKTVSKCHAGDTYSPEAGLTMCILKKIQEKSLINLFDAWLPKEVYTTEKPVTLNVKQVRKQFKKK